MKRIILSLHLLSLARRPGVGAVSAMTSDGSGYRSRGRNAEARWRDRVATGDRGDRDERCEDRHALGRAGRLRRPVARGRPGAQRVLPEEEGATRPLHDDPVGQVPQARGERALRAAVEAVVVQDAVHGVGARVVAGPCGLPAPVVLAAALRARAVACGQRGRLVEEEQLGVLARLAKRALAALELDSARDPAPQLPGAAVLAVVGVQHAAV